MRFPALVDGDSTVKQRAVKGAAATVAGQACSFLATMASTLILARLLDPMDFGLIAMVTAVTGFFALFQDAGLSTATEVRGDVTNQQISTLFWINTALGTAVAASIALCSPLIAWFYGEPRLAGISIAFGSLSLLGGVAAQHQALLRRSMRFYAVASIQACSAFGSLVAGVGTALAGCGIWSLVIMNLTNAVINCALSLWLSGWWPGLPARNSGVASLVRFGGAMTFSKFTSVVGGAADRILIGRFLGSEALGLYTRAQALLFQPVQQLLPPLSSVAVPALSRLRSNDTTYGRTILRILEVVALISSFAAAWMLLSADWLVLILLGEKWAASSEIFRFFAVTAFTLPTSTVVSWVLITRSRSRELMLYGVLNNLILVGSIAAALPWGLAAVAMSYSLSGLLLRVPLLYYLVGKCGPLNAWELARVTGPGVILGGIVVLALYQLRAGLLNVRPVYCVVATLLGVAACYVVIAATTNWGWNATKAVAAVARQLKVHSATPK